MAQMRADDLALRAYLGVAPDLPLPQALVIMNERCGITPDAGANFPAQITALLEMTGVSDPKLQSTSTLSC